MRRRNSLKGPLTILFSIILVLGMFAALYKLNDDAQNITTLSYKKFLDAVRNNKISNVVISGHDAEGAMIDGKRFQSVIAHRSKDYDLLEEHNVDFSLQTQSSGLHFGIISWLVFIAIVLAFAWYNFRQGKGGSSGGMRGGGPANLFGIGKSKAKMFPPSTIKEKFTSVAGAHEAKEDLKDLVDFLKNPKKYEKLGARVNRGILLVGEPGTGKTLLARAVAGEANCPFFSVSGSDFIEVFVGVGAARIRDLFAQAKKNAPCIVFIDEIDAVGRQRGSGLGGGNDEREQTLNQLLTEMDGFEVDEKPVIVLAATNRPDVLDKALLRPGRFDREIDVPLPDMKSRIEILKVHLKKIKVADDVNAETIARGTPGYTGAQLANLINEAALMSSKKDLSAVTMHEFEEARDKLEMGKERTSLMQTKEELTKTAYHEGGHALVRLFLPKDTDPLHKVTIVPRGRALGVTHFLPEKDKTSANKEQMLAEIASILGGKAAEELIFNEITTGPSSDLKMATRQARAMARLYGMTDVGMAVYEEESAYKQTMSEQTMQRIDATVEKILEEQYQVAIDILKTHRDKLEKLANALLEKETLYASEVYELLDITPRTNLKFVDA